MAFSFFKIIKGLLIREEGTQVPKEIEIIPGGTAGYKTTITSSTNSSNKTLTLPNATDTLVGKATSDIFTNKSIDAEGTGNVISNIANTNIKTGAAIDASKIADGSVSNTEFQYINSVTSNVQTQLNTNATDISNHISDAVAAHAASAISVTPSGNLTSTDAQNALSELQTDIDTRATTNNPTFTGTDFNASSNTNTDIATSNTTSTVDIGTGTGSNVINIGGANSTINFTGTVNNQNVTNLNVTDKLVTINKGGATSSGGSSGLEIEENSSITGYAQTSSDRNSWNFKAPNSAGITSLTPGSSNDTVALLAKSQVLTNKDLDGGTASNTSRITLPKDTISNLQSLTRKEGTLVYASDLDKPYYDDGTNLKVIGSGSGGITNFITDGDAEASNIFTSYKDAAGTRPVDGTGGSPSVTSSVSATSPLAGLKSFLLTKPSSNCQGEGWSIPFTIDTAYKAKVLQISADYLVNSGTFTAGSSTTDSDVIFYIYDVTNSQLIEPSNFKLFSNNSSIAFKFEGSFQTSATGSSYRLIAHVTTTSTSAFELKVDNISVNPSNYVYGSPITDWLSFTPSGSWTSNVTYTGKWRRIGDSMEIQTMVTGSGVPTAANLTLDLPSGYTIDTSKILGTSLDSISFGNGIITDVGVNNYPTVNIGYNNSTSVVPFIGNASGTYTSGTFITNSVPFSFNTGDYLFVNYTVPITGWSSSVQMSDQTDTRIISAFYNGQPTGTLNTSDNLITIPTKVIDTHLSMSSGTYRVPVSGQYAITAQVGLNTTSATANQYFTLSIKQNGVLKSESVLRAEASSIDGRNPQIHAELDCIAGDTITLTSNTNMTSISYNSNTTRSYIRIERLSGPSAIASTETIACEYNTNAGGSLGNAIATFIDFGTKITDTHGAVIGAGNGNNTIYTNTWRYIVPSSGYYQINACLGILFPGTTDIDFLVRIYINGVEKRRGTRSNVTTFGGGSYENVLVSSTIFCYSGDAISIGGFQSSGGARTLEVSSPSNHVSIIRIG